MYISTFSPLQSALSGIEAAQQELQTTSNNIANANTTGYTEESVNLSQASSLTFAGPNGLIQVGTGVNATSITSARNQYLDTSYRAQNAASNYATTEQNYVNQAQSALDEPSRTGISSQLQSFWKSWNSLASSPNSEAAKQAVVSNGTALASSIKQLYAEYSPDYPTSIPSQAQDQYNTLTVAGGQVDSDAQAIATLYPEIQQAKAAGEDPNDLQDKYNQALDDLSSLANVTVQTDSSTGNVNVYLGDATDPLVSIPPTGQATVTLPQNMTAASGGTLGALINLTDTDPSTGPIAAFVQNLNSFATDLTNSVNSLSPGQGFFAASTDPAALNIQVDPTVAADPTQVQSSSSGSAAGDVAAAISNLSGGTADQDYAGFVATIGSSAQSANSSATTQQALATAVGNQRQGVEGVDLSQEETNVIQEQQAYQASAQVMNAFNTMINTLITQVG